MFFYEYPLEKIAEVCELSGYDGVEFWIETPHYWMDRDVKKLEVLKKYTKSVHCAVLDLNPCSVNEMIREVTLKTNLSGLEIARFMECHYIIHAGKRSASREPVTEDRIASERYFRVISKAGKIKGVEILLENSEPGVNYLCRNYEEVLENARKFYFGITFDVNHALRNGDAERYAESIEMIKNIHVSSYDVNGRHVGGRFSDGVSSILEFMKNAGYDGLITVELDDLGYGKMSFHDKLRELENEREFLEKIFRN